jgi:hypothetical protein
VRPGSSRASKSSLATDAVLGSGAVRRGHGDGSFFAFHTLHFIRSGVLRGPQRCARFDYRAPSSCCAKFLVAPSVPEGETSVPDGRMSCKALRTAMACTPGSGAGVSWLTTGTRLSRSLTPLGRCVGRREGDGEAATPSWPGRRGDAGCWHQRNTIC